MSLTATITIPGADLPIVTDAEQLWNDLREFENDPQLRETIAAAWLLEHGVENGHIRPGELEGFISSILQKTPDDKPPIEEIAAEIALDCFLARVYPGIPNDYREWPIDEKRLWESQVNNVIAREAFWIQSWQGKTGTVTQELIIAGTGDEELARTAKIEINQQKMAAKIKAR